MAEHHQLSNLIWQTADLLRGPYQPPQYERVMLPMTVLLCFDCVLAPTKQDVLAKYEQWKEQLQDDALDAMLKNAAKQPFYNRSELTFEKLKSDIQNIDKHLISYINGFSKNVRDIFERFEFAAEIKKMNEANILYLVVSKFCDIDLHLDAVDPMGMGLLFEDLIRRFYEAANKNAGVHFTPREVIRLMVDILFDPDYDLLTKPITCKLLDPTCGTGGMLVEAQNYLRSNSKKAQLRVFGQDFNPHAYAIAASDLLMKGDSNSAIRFGDSLIDDKYAEDRFDYLLANPPFRADWKRQQKDLKQEHEKLGFAGRFGAGLPRVNDGSLLFLQHMISKFKPYQPENNKNGSRLAIVFNGSPLFTGGAGSGESEIRKWVIENDWLEVIIALPEHIFYNTGIVTYIWIVTNRKQKHRQGKIQLIDARSDKFYIFMRRNLGDKRRKIGGTEPNEPNHIAEIVRLYGNFEENEYSKIFDNEYFGYNHVPIERPLRLLYQMDLERKSRFLDAVPNLLDDVQAIDKELGREPRPDWNEFEQLMADLLKQRSSRWKKSEKKLFRDVFTERNAEAKAVIIDARNAPGDPYSRVWGWFPVPGEKVEFMYEADSKLRVFKNINLQDEIVRFFREEVELQVSDAWVDKKKIRTAYKINFNLGSYQSPDKSR